MHQMSLAVRSVLSQYAVFSGRASRPEFWWWSLAVLIAQLVTRLIDAFLIAPLLGFQVGDENAGDPLSLILSLAVLLPAIAVGARRLHDIGKSGWWLLLGLVPIIGGLVLIYFYLQPSDDTNKWGHPNPLG